MQKISKFSCFTIVATLLLCTQLSVASTIQSVQQRQLDSITDVLRMKDQQISILEENIGFLSKMQTAEVELINQCNQNISNELEASGRTVSVWGVIISCLALFLGVFISIFVTKKRDQIKDISNLVAETKDEVDTAYDKINERLSKATDTLAEAISKVKEFKEVYSDFRKHSSEIYRQMRREETKEILRRLVDVPEDVSNVLTLLLSRTLEPCDFKLLNQAFDSLSDRYKKLSETSPNPEIWTRRYKIYEKKYAIVFYQHFLGKAIVSNSLKDPMLEHLDYVCRCAFINDMLKSTCDLKVELSVMNWDEVLPILSKYVVACTKSEYKDEPKVYEIILEGMSNNDVLSLWRSCSEKTTDAITFSTVVKRLLLSSGVSPSSADMVEIVSYITKGTK